MTRKEIAMFLYTLHKELKFTALGTSFVRLRNGDLDVIENGGIHVLYLDKKNMPESYIFTSSISKFDRDWLIDGSFSDPYEDVWDEFGLDQNEPNKLGFVCEEHLLQALKHDNFEYAINEFLFVNKMNDFNDNCQKGEFDNLISNLEHIIKNR